VIHPIPPGTRDVLPDEMRELRILSERLRSAFEDAGYGEVWTPAVEYEEVLRIGDERAAGAGYRLFDEHGAVLALRSVMTVPIARVVATRYAAAEPPLRFSYFAHAYRAVRPQRGQPREFLQAGVELVGAPAPDRVGAIEILEAFATRLRRGDHGRHGTALEAQAADGLDPAGDRRHVGGGLLGLRAPLPRRDAQSQQQHDERERDPGGGSHGQGM